MQPAVVNQLFKVKVLAQAAASSSTSSVLAGGSCGLYTTDTATLTSQSVLADLVQPTWTGYAQQVNVWEPAYRSIGDAAELVALSSFFLGGANANSLIAGYFCTARDGTLAFSQAYDTPVPVVGAQGVMANPVYRLT